jgi:hypothetical protein
MPIIGDCAHAFFLQILVVDLAIELLLNIGF